MKRFLMWVVILAMAGGLTAFAFAQTTLDVLWDSWGGNVTVDFQAGDDNHTWLDTGGNHFFGEFHGINYDDNPYSYNVDTVRAKVRANIEGGGYLEFGMDRQDSYVPMYGPSGQSTYTYLETSDLGFFATNTRTNFADMITHNYGWQSNSQWTASGDYFFIIHWIRAGDPSSNAGFTAEGSGSVDVTLMSSEARGQTSWRLGEGAGCYTNAHASGTGSGYFIIGGQAPNNLSAFGGVTIGGGSVLLDIYYNNGFSVNNLNMSGH